MSCAFHDGFQIRSLGTSIVKRTVGGGAWRSRAIPESGTDARPAEDAHREGRGDEPATARRNGRTRRRGNPACQRVFQLDARVTDAPQARARVLLEAALDQLPDVPGTAAFSSGPQSGSRSRIPARTSVAVSPLNTRLPVRASYSTHPKDQMSVRVSRALPHACSGLMYGTVPRMTPWTVGSASFETVSATIRDGSDLERLGEAEIEDLHLSLVGHFDVGRLQVAMDDAPLVRGLESLGNLNRDRHSVANGKRSPGPRARPASGRVRIPAPGTPRPRTPPARGWPRCWRG